MYRIDNMDTKQEDWRAEAPDYLRKTREDTMSILAGTMAMIQQKPTVDEDRNRAFAEYTEAFEAQETADRASTVLNQCRENARLARAKNADWVEAEKKRDDVQLIAVLTQSEALNKAKSARNMAQSSLSP